MLRWAFVFFALAVACAVLGFGGFAQDLAWLAKVMAAGFLAGALVFVFMGRGAP